MLRSQSVPAAAQIMHVRRLAALQCSALPPLCLGFGRTLPFPVIIEYDIGGVG